MAHGGIFYAYLASDASKEKAARKSLLEEIRELQNVGIQEKDVERAKAYYAGSNRIRLQTNSARTARHADNYLYGLGLDFDDKTLRAIEKLTVDDLRAVAEKYLAHDHYIDATLRGTQ